MASYMQTAVQILKSFDFWTLSNIERSLNQFTDALSKLTSSPIPCQNEPIYIKELTNSSLNEQGVLVISEIQDWRTPIIQYIKGTLAEEDEIQKEG